MRALLHPILLAAAAAALSAAELPLLDLVPAGTAGIAGVNVQRTAASPLGRLLLQRIAGRDEMLRRITKVSGTALWEKLDEVILLAGPAVGEDGGRTAILARPFPDAVTLAKWLPGVKRTSHNGFDLFLVKRGGIESAFALAGGDVGVAGDPDQVRAVLDRAAAQQTAVERSPLMERAGEIRLKFDVWAVADGRFRTPERAARRTRVPQMSGRIQQMGGGLVFGDDVQLSGQMLTRTADEARTLAELFRFVGSLAERNGGGPVPRNLSVAAAESAVQLSFTLTPADFRRLLESEPEP